MVLVFDKFGKPLGTIDFIELQWSRKYLECGSFVLYLTADAYMPDMKYVKYNDRPETGLVQKVEYEEKVSGKFITVSGFFVDKVLDWGAVAFAFNFEEGWNVEKMLKEYMCSALNLNFDTGEIERGVMDTGKRVVRKLEFDADSAFPTAISNAVPAGQALGQALYNILSGDNWSYTCTPVYYTDESKPLLGLTVNFWKGQDLRNTVRFSDSLNNVSRVNYTYDESGEFSRYMILQALPEGTSAIDWPTDYGVVTGWIEEGKLKSYFQTYYEYDGNRPQDMGLTKPEKVFFSQIDGIDLVPANAEVLSNKMKAAAQVDMLSNYKVESIAAEVLQERFFYRKDYDLGDICTVSIDAIRQMYTARIIEVDEVYSSNKLDVTVVLGTPQKQKWRAM
ncbi:hypothetical protein H8692_05660 [Mogibacterium sp. NSJ-24]|jgi:hypothetical protein|uniref:Gp28/Gp37-like domain-containing protein n=1 Tax=Lentihominibacter hominis TaxID=2763645 RepID=A0A926E5K9_9FIRM|nr:hypothetical protein [Lentihominibacter hominis]MBC8568250.1 hypothetical protein [Lentihominibacter hominis]